MTRRKKPPPQQKRQQVTDSAGWTHVIKGPSGVTVPKRTNVRLERENPSTESKYTLETYLDRFRNHHVPIWKQSDCFKSLSRILEQDMIPPDQTNMPITRCVCLGLGSMTAGSESSSYELAALTSMLEILGNTYTHISPSSPTPQKANQPPNRQTPPHPPKRNLPRSNLHLARPQHPASTRPHRPRHPGRLSPHRRLDVPLRAPPRMPALRHGPGGRDARFDRRVGRAGLCAWVSGCAATGRLSPSSSPLAGRYRLTNVCVSSLLSAVAESSKKGSCQIFRDFMGKVDSRPMPDFDRTPWCESTRIYWVRSQQGDSGQGVIEQGVTSLNLDER